MDINALLALVPVKYIGLVFAISGLFATITAIIPPPKNRRTAWGFFYTFMDWCAQNVGHGKTAAAAVAHGEVVPASAVPVVVVPPPAVVPPVSPAPKA